MLLRRLRIVAVALGNVSNTKHSVDVSFFRVFAVQVVGLELRVDFFKHRTHGDVLVDHDIVDQFHTQQPRRHRWHIGLQRVEVCHHLAILRHYRVSGIAWVHRIVPDLCGSANTTQGGVFQTGLHLLGTLLVSRKLFVQINVHAGRSDLLGHVDDFFQARHSQRYVLGRHSSIVERVQGHLCGWFSNRLSGHSSDHFSRMHLGLLESIADLSQQPIERTLIELVFADHTLRRQSGTQEDVKQ